MLSKGIFFKMINSTNNNFEDTVKRIAPVLKRITYRLNGHFSFFNEEDLFQEALLRLWQDFNYGKLNDKTDSYILQGCYFYLKNYLRKNYDKANLIRLDNLREGEDSDLGEILSLKDPYPYFDAIHCKMLEEEIKNNGLTKREKEVFSLALEGLTTREIGNRLGISHVRVVKLRNKIKEKCKKRFK